MFLTFESVDKNYGAVLRYVFMLYKVVLTSKSVDESLMV